ncbi:MAG: hypothetical protein ACRCU2_14845 [Planktothrix sp.]
MKCLNIGCGSNFHASWTNIDISSVYPGVQTYDIRKGLPFADLSFDDRYNLDMLDGKVRKPDSLFMEGIKP